MSQQPAFQRRTQCIYNDYRYPMPKTREPVDGAKYPATWGWEQTLSGGIVFKANDGVYGQADKNSKLKEVEMGWADRNSLFNLMENAINDVNFTKAQYHVKKKIFGAGGRMNDQPSTLATFTVVRTPEGKVMVGYTKGTYKLMFDFSGPNDSIVVVQRDGQAVEDHGMMSRIFTKAFIDFSRKGLDKMELEGYKPREKKDNGGGNNNGGNGNGGNNWGGNRGGNGGGGNGNNWGGNNNGGGNSQPRQQAEPDFDADIDF